MSLFTALHSLLFGSSTPTEAVQESPCYQAVRLADGRVDAAARQKHLFRGEEFCLRGCGSTNPKFKTPETVEVIA